MKFLKVCFPGGLGTHLAGAESWSRSVRGHSYKVLGYLIIGLILLALVWYQGSLLLLLLLFVILLLLLLLLLLLVVVEVVAYIVYMLITIICYRARVGCCLDM